MIKLILNTDKDLQIDSGENKIEINGNGDKAFVSVVAKSGAVIEATIREDGTMGVYQQDCLEVAMPYKVIDVVNDITRELEGLICADGTIKSTDMFKVMLKFGAVL